MRLRQEREHGNPQAVQMALHLREVPEARDRSGPVTGPRLPPHGGRQVLEKHLGHPDRQASLELPPKEIELRRAALDEEDLDAPAQGRGDPDAGQAQDAHRHVIGSHPQGRRADHGVLQEAFAVGQGERGGDAEATNTPLPRRASTYPRRLRSSIARATVFGLMPRKPASSRMLGRAWSRDAAGLDEVLQLLRQLPADRDRAAGIHAQTHPDRHAV